MSVVRGRDSRAVVPHFIGDGACFPGCEHHRDDRRIPLRLAARDGRLQHHRPRHWLFQWLPLARRRGVDANRRRAHDHDARECEHRPRRQQRHRNRALHRDVRQSHTSLRMAPVFVHEFCGDAVARSARRGVAGTVCDEASQPLGRAPFPASVRTRFSALISLCLRVR